MRGKVWLKDFQEELVGITPAYAGKSVHYLTTSRSI